MLTMGARVPYTDQDIERGVAALDAAEFVLHEAWDVTRSILDAVAPHLEARAATTVADRLAGCLWASPEDAEMAVYVAESVASDILDAS